MLKSMTGFGRADEIVDGRHIIVEIKSVNHKYFEFSTRITRGYAFLEEKLKSFIQSSVSRGKVDAYVHVENIDVDDVEVTVNHSLAAGYINALRELNEKYSLEGDVTADSLTKFTDIFSIHKAPEDEERVWNDVKTVTEKALSNFIEMREREGSKLYDDIVSRAETILGIVGKIEVRSPETVKEYREKLETKLRELLEDRNIDDTRILTETAIFADKIAVDEETVRLRSHISQLKQFADSKDPIGRKMDFLVQEMNRETNTIGSKCSDSDIAYMVVDIKAEIEKIREQVQNIE